MQVSPVKVFRPRLPTLDTSVSINIDRSEFVPMDYIVHAVVVTHGRSGSPVLKCAQLLRWKYCKLVELAAAAAGVNIGQQGTSHEGRTCSCLHHQSSMTREIFVIALLGGRYRMSLSMFAEISHGMHTSVCVWVSSVQYRS